MNISKQRKKLAMVAVLGATVMSAATANAAMVTFAEGDILSSIGSSFSLDLVGRDFAFGTTGGNILIDFDPAVLQISSSVINTAIFDFSNNDTTAPNTSVTIDNVNGQNGLKLSSFFGASASPADTLFATITFDVIGATAGPLSFGMSDNIINPNFISSWTYDTGVAASGVYCVEGNPTDCTASLIGERLAFASTTYSVAAVPVPAAVWLFGSGLLGLVGVSRRKAA